MKTSKRFVRAVALIIVTMMMAVMTLGSLFPAVKAEEGTVIPLSDMDVVAWGILDHFVSASASVDIDKKTAIDGRKLFDGDDNTSWGGNNDANGSDNWIVIDLGGIYDLTEIFVNYSSTNAWQYIFLHASATLSDLNNLTTIPGNSETSSAFIYKTLGTNDGLKKPTTIAKADFANDMSAVRYLRLFNGSNKQIGIYTLIVRGILKNTVDDARINLPISAKIKPQDSGNTTLDGFCQVKNDKTQKPNMDWIANVVDTPSEGRYNEFLVDLGGIYDLSSVEVFRRSGSNTLTVSAANAENGTYTPMGSIIISDTLGWHKSSGTPLQDVRFLKLSATGSTHTTITEIRVFGKLKQTVEQKTVSFDPKNGSPAFDVYVDKDAEIGTKIPANPTKGRDLFTGWWYKDGSGNEVALTVDTVITDNLNIYAKWLTNILIASAKFSNDKQSDDSKCNYSVLGDGALANTYNSNIGSDTTTIDLGSHYRIDMIRVHRASTMYALVNFDLRIGNDIAGTALSNPVISVEAKAATNPNPGPPAEWFTYDGKDGDFARYIQLFKGNNNNSQIDEIEIYGTPVVELAGATVNLSNPSFALGTLAFHATSDGITLPAGCTVVEFGTIMLRNSMLAAEELTLDTAGVAKAFMNNPSGLTVPKSWYAFLTPNGVDKSSTVTVPAEYASTRYAARPYIIYEDAEQQKHVLYGNTYDSSVNKVRRAMAKKLVENGIPCGALTAADMLDSAKINIGDVWTFVLANKENLM